MIIGPQRQLHPAQDADHGDHVWAKPKLFFIQMGLSDRYYGVWFTADVWVYLAH